MRIINQQEISRLKNELDFYNFKQFETNNKSKIVVKFNNDFDPITYSDMVLYEEKKEVFENKKNILIKFIDAILKYIENDKCFLLKYNEKWVVTRSKSNELSYYLKDNHIRNNQNCGIEINKDDKLLTLFLDSVFKYNSFIQIIFKTPKIIITPTDHMDVFFDAPDIKYLNSFIQKNMNHLNYNYLIAETETIL